MTLPISVIIPVGPLPRHILHLQECLDSVRSQSSKPDEILVIDNRGYREPMTYMGDDVTIHQFYYPLGIATALNKGVELAQNELVFFLGSDDILYPNCLKRCWQAWKRENEALGWYYVGVRYSDDREQNTACLAAMTSKEVWSNVGRFNPDVKSCEIAFISKILEAKGELGGIYQVSKEMLYWHRIHE